MPPLSDPSRSVTLVRRLAVLALLAGAGACAADAPTAPESDTAQPAATQAAVRASESSDDDPTFAVRDALRDPVPSLGATFTTALDIRRTIATFDGTTFRFRAAFAGPIAQTPGALYVFGVDRGAGTARFPAIVNGVLFDLVVVVAPGGNSFVRDLIAGVTTNLPAEAIVVQGNRLRVRVPAELLPSRGAAPNDYTFNLWSRSGAGGNETLADFAPDNANAPIKPLDD